jgi:uncharacterized protein YndB with AHSA1/START domain
MNSMGVVGTLHDLGNGTGTVRMEEVFDTDIRDLWSALTDPGRLSRWLAVVSGDLRAGGTIHARFTSTWDGPGRIDICDAPHRLLATMEPGAPDETVIEAVLTAEGGKTRLVIEERGLPLADLPGHGAGWQAHIEDLATYLDGNEPGDWKTRWTDLMPRYRDLTKDLS